jgi:FtsZ-interacting cell division protein ZipA
MDIVLIVIIIIVALAVIGLLVAVSRRGAVRRKEAHEARQTAREAQARAEMKEADMHRARAEVAQSQAEREQLHAEVHETRAQAGYDGKDMPDRDTVRESADVVEEGRRPNRS